MGTYTAFHLQSTDVDRIREACVAWLQTTHRVQSVSVERGPLPLAALARVFDEKAPSLLAIGVAHPGWTFVHYNSFNKMGDLVARLSDLLSCLGVVVLAQTVSDYYFIDVYKSGARLRTLEFAEDEGWLVQEGTPLPFEKAPLGENIADPGEKPYYFFRESDAEAYCNGLGFSIWEGYAPEWMILRARRKRWWCPFRHR